MNHKIGQSYKEYVAMAKNGTLPADFDQWELANEYGWTVAHVAAQWGYLPVLGPETFSRWDLADGYGSTVAHEVARIGTLPENFSQWGLVDNNGLTVLRQLLSSSIKSDKYVTMWRKERPLCNADVDWHAFKVELPEIYAKHTIDTSMGDASSTCMSIIL
jgi:hypothetical protein